MRTVAAARDVACVVHYLVYICAACFAQAGAEPVTSTNGPPAGEPQAAQLQPFLSYTTRTAWTIGPNTESTYDWTAEKWSVPVHFTVSKLVHVGTQPMSFGAGPRCWLASPAGGPHGCAVRFWITALFPRRH